MRKKIDTTILFFIIFSLHIRAQQINANITINYDQISISNVNIFKKLQSSLINYVNNTNFIETPYKKEERITCDFFIVVKNFSDNSNFFGTLRVQSYRPVYGTDYETPIFTYVDEAFNFKYIEDDPLFYNPHSFNSNLLSIIDYYCYLIIGLDIDTFNPDVSNNTGYEKANKVVDLAVSSGYSGWEIESENRSVIANELINEYFKNFRKGIYQYHMQGMDKLYLEDKLEAKKSIVSSTNMILDLYEPSYSQTIKSFLTSKYKELNNIFTDENEVENQEHFINRLSNNIPEFSSIRKK